LDEAAGLFAQRRRKPHDIARQAVINEAFIGKGGGGETQGDGECRKARPWTHENPSAATSIRRIARPLRDGTPISRRQLSSR
jgi:hypothetical protein